MPFLCSYKQLTVETYCMSLADTDLANTVHPRCAGRCRQVKVAQEAIVKDRNGNNVIRPIVVNSGCEFVPTAGTGDP